MSAPSRLAASAERRSFPHGSLPQARWVISSVGACKDRTGTRYRSLSSEMASSSRLTWSTPTINSTPSKPTSAAKSNALAVESG